jgi:hypothetical protein
MLVRAGARGARVDSSVKLASAAWRLGEGNHESLQERKMECARRIALWFIFADLVKHSLTHSSNSMIRSDCRVVKRISYIII